MNLSLTREMKPIYVELNNQYRTQRGYMMANEKRVSISEGGTSCVGNIHTCGLILFSVA